MANFKPEWKCSFPFMPFDVVPNNSPMRGKMSSRGERPAQVWSLSHIPSYQWETWTAGMITQPFLKEENDNNHRRACHGKQPRGCLWTSQSASAQGDILGLVQRETCSVPCVLWKWKWVGTGGWSQSPCLLNTSLASQRNKPRLRGPRRESHGPELVAAYVQLFCFPGDFSSFAQPQWSHRGETTHLCPLFVPHPCHSCCLCTFFISMFTRALRWR